MSITPEFFALGGYADTAWHPSDLAYLRKVALYGKFPNSYDPLGHTGPMSEEPVSLLITLEGSSPDLANGRLSLSAFNDAFRELLKAYKAIGSGIMVSSGTPQARGRRHRLAEQMDLEIDTITHSSPSAIRFVCPVPLMDGNQTELAKMLVTRSASGLLDSVEAESQGTHRNKYIRKFLDKLPGNSVRHTWEMYEGSKLVRRLTLATLEQPESTGVSPGFLKLEGRVIGVQFPPKGEVRIISGGDKSTFSATPEQVEIALTLRNESVTVLGLNDARGTRLLWIRATSSQAKRPTAAERDQYYASRWKGLLELLAK